SLERVHYVIASAPPEVKARAVRHARAASPAKLMAPKVPTIALDIPAPALDIATDTGELDLASKIVDSSDFAPRTLAEAIGASLVNRRATTTPADGIYRAESVDRVVTPFGDNPRPAYPRSLEAAGVEADFTVMFVVDSTGRVEERSVDVPRNVHRMFADAVRYALARSRYLPAQLGGQAVRQLVAQEFVFRMQR
ncbi:MAG: energy transducer TonB, partial [Gemmatimonadaceae bacterium]